MGLKSNNQIKISKVPPLFIQKNNFKAAEAFIKKALGLSYVDYSKISVEDANLINKVLLDEYNLKPFKFRGILTYGKDERIYNIGTYMAIEDYDKKNKSLLYLNTTELKDCSRNITLDKEIIKIKEEKEDIIRFLDDLEKRRGKDIINTKRYQDMLNKILELDERLEIYQLYRGEEQVFLVSDYAKSREEFLIMILTHEIAHIRTNNMGTTNNRVKAIRACSRLPERSMYPKTMISASDFKKENSEYVSYIDEKVAELYTLYRTKPEILTVKEKKFIETFFRL